MRLLKFAALVTLMMTSAKAETRLPPYIASAVADPGRPEADRARDPLRQPGETIEFAGLKPGDNVAASLVEARQA